MDRVLLSVASSAVLVPVLLLTCVWCVAMSQHEAAQPASGDTPSFAAALYERVADDLVAAANSNRGCFLVAELCNNAAVGDAVKVTTPRIVNLL